MPAATGCRRSVLTEPRAECPGDALNQRLADAGEQRFEQELEQELGHSLLDELDRPAGTVRRHVGADHALVPVGADRRHAEHEVVDGDVLAA